MERITKRSHITSESIKLEDIFPWVYDCYHDIQETDNAIPANVYKNIYPILTDRFKTEDKLNNIYSLDNKKILNIPITVIGNSVIIDTKLLNPLELFVGKMDYKANNTDMMEKIIAHLLCLPVSNEEVNDAQMDTTKVIKGSGVDTIAVLSRYNNKTRSLYRKLNIGKGDKALIDIYSIDIILPQDRFSVYTDVVIVLKTTNVQPADITESTNQKNIDTKILNDLLTAATKNNSWILSKSEDDKIYLSRDNVKIASNLENSSRETYLSLILKSRTLLSRRDMLFKNTNLSIKQERTMPNPNTTEARRYKPIKYIDGCDNVPNDTENYDARKHYSFYLTEKAKKEDILTPLLNRIAICSKQKVEDGEYESTIVQEQDYSNVVAPGSFMSLLKVHKRRLL